MKTSFIPWLKSPKHASLVLAAGLALATVSTGHAQTLFLSLQSQNYNPTTGVWSDPTTGDSATSSGSVVPTLTANATPNGSSAVSFVTGSALTLATSIPASASYTAFVFLQPSTTTPNGFTNGSGGTIFGGNGGAFQYRLSSGRQDIVQAAQADLGQGTATLSTTSFSTIDTTTSASGGTYRLNGAADGTSGGGNFSAPILFIGTNQLGNGNEFFNGSIADIEIYSGILTPAQIQGVEANFTAEYVNAPEPSTWAMALVGVGALLGVQRFRARKA